jgi:predicted transcriptional regulator
MAKKSTRYRTGRTELMGIRFKPTVKELIIKLARRRDEPMSVVIEKAVEMFAAKEGLAE